MPLDTRVRSAIVQAAQEHGLDPSTALAIAERESSFNVNGRAPGSTAYGLFQLLRSERAKFGGNSQDPLEQSRAWANYIKEHNDYLRKALGRDPTGEETYLSHHFGPSRAARLVSGGVHPETPVSDIFTPQELAVNPHIGRAGTAGNLTSSIMADISRRRAKHGGEFQPTGADLSQYGEAPEQEPTATTPSMQGKLEPVDLSKYGTEPAPTTQGGPEPVDVTPIAASNKPRSYPSPPGRMKDEIISQDRAQLRSENSPYGWITPWISPETQNRTPYGKPARRDAGEDWMSSDYYTRNFGPLSPWNGARPLQGGDLKYQLQDQPPALPPDWSRFRPADPDVST